MRTCEVSTVPGHTCTYHIEEISIGVLNLHRYFNMITPYFNSKKHTHMQTKQVNKYAEFSNYYNWTRCQFVVPWPCSPDISGHRSLKLWVEFRFQISGCPWLSPTLCRSTIRQGGREMSDPGLYETGPFNPSRSIRIISTNENFHMQRQATLGG